MSIEHVEDPRFQKIVPNAAKVIYAWDKKILSFANRKFIKMTTYRQKIQKRHSISLVRINWQHNGKSKDIQPVTDNNLITLSAQKRTLIV